MDEIIFGLPVNVPSASSTASSLHADIAGVNVTIDVMSSCSFLYRLKAVTGS